MTRRPSPRRFYRPWLDAQPYERWPGDWLPEREMQRADEPLTLADLEYDPA